MKNRLGMEHVGLGTDGGGGLPGLVEGYRDIVDLLKLVKAMQEPVFRTLKWQLIWAGIFIGYSEGERASVKGGCLLDSIAQRV